MSKKLKLIIGLTFFTSLIILIGYFTAIKQERIQTEPKPDFAAKIIPQKKEYSVLEGAPIPIIIQLENTGNKGWLHTGREACLLSYHLLDKERECIQFDNRRLSLPEKVPSGHTIKFRTAVQSPLSEGTYILEFDLLREGIAWFEDNGSPTAEVELKVIKRDWKDNHTWFYSSLEEINYLYKLIRITLEENEVEFKGKSGPIYGFLPGKNYSQIWLRDSNTIIPAAQNFYDHIYLTSWLEEHLYYQQENGSLFDWIDSQGNMDKNTTETDQEASAVQAAYQIYELLGANWLQKKIKGEKIIDRLELSLEYILQNRMDEKLGLLMGAHTADWGDVDMVDKDKKAIYVDENTQWTVDIYDQAMFYKACMELAEMLDSLKENKASGKWRKKALALRTNTNQKLWQKDKGFYRIHLHLSSFKHEFDEDDMFAMGGNAMAVLSGIADAHQAQKIIETALSRQKQYHMSTISGTILPPYPKNVFKHALMDDPFEYQNGSQWDWFGARLVYTMFENGFSDKAQDKLLEIIKKNITNRGFFEWDTREGSGIGSHLFCGSAGTLAQTAVEGYFGVKLKRNSLSLEPKLGKESGQIRVHQPANDLFASYDYQYDEKKHTITFQYKSSFKKPGYIKILIPQRKENQACPFKKEDFKLLIDGKEADFDIITIHTDSFFVFQTDFNDHTAVIIL